MDGSPKERAVFAACGRIHGGVAFKYPGYGVRLVPRHGTRKADGRILPTEPSPRDRDCSILSILGASSKREARAIAYVDRPLRDAHVQVAARDILPLDNLEGGNAKVADRVRIRIERCWADFAERLAVVGRSRQPQRVGNLRPARPIVLPYPPQHVDDHRARIRFAQRLLRTAVEVRLTVPQARIRRPRAVLQVEPRHVHRRKRVVPAHVRADHVVDDNIVDHKTGRAGSHHSRSGAFLERETAHRHVRRRAQRDAGMEDG